MVSILRSIWLNGKVGLNPYILIDEKVERIMTIKIDVNNVRYKIINGYNH